MSRFPELFEEAIEAVVGTEALHVEALAEDIARHIVGRQSALRAEARITAQWPVRRTTPVSKLSTQELVSLVGIAAATADRVRRVVGVEATGINACPCAQGLVRGRAAERLAEAGYEDVERILDLVPLATHNQRGRGSLYVGTERQLDANDLVAIVAGVDERADLRAAEAARRAVRRRARAPAAPLRRGLRAALDQGRARGDPRPRRRRFRLRTPDQLRDDPCARRPRRARGHGRRAPRRARRRRSGREAHEPRRLARRPRAGFGPRRKWKRLSVPAPQARDVRPCAGRARRRQRSQRRRPPATAPRARARRTGARRR